MNYDGPSYYKKNDPETKLNKERKKVRVDSSKPQFSDKRKTSAQIESEAKKYITPPPYDLGKSVKKSTHESQKKERFFRTRKIPQSLQNLDGWRKTEWNQGLLAELEERLFKREEEYLLFGEEFEEGKNEAKGQVEITAPSQEKEIESQKKINKVQKKMKKDLSKPATGLHRSLSGIIAEDKEALKNGKNNLDSLFI